MIFNHYDESGDGRIDYREFSTILHDDGTRQTPAQAVR